MKKSFTTLLLVLIMAVPVSAFAGGFCCQMPSGVQEDGTLGGGSFSLRADYTTSPMSSFVMGDEYINITKLMDLPRFTPMVAGQKAVFPETMDMQRYTITASYAPTEKLRITMSVPWIINDMTMISVTRMSMMMGGGLMVMKMNMEQVNEIGDLTLLGSYRVWEDQEINPKAALYVGAGVKTPTGSSTVSEGGKRIHAHMQPGTGSWDPIFTASFAKMLGSSFVVQADARYQIATKNNLNYSFGDTALVNAGVKYNVLDFLNVSLGVSYFHSEQADDPDNKYNGKDSLRLTDFAGYTGEDSVWINPGIQVLPFRNASVDFRFQYPVYYHVPDVEFVTDYRLTAGISYAF